MLTPHLLRAAALSPFKRPDPDAPLPRSRPTLTGVRPRPDHLAAYSRLCGYRTPQQAHQPLPLTYPHVLSFPLAMRLMTARDFPLPLLGLVHTSIEITQHRTLTTTDSLELSVHASHLAPHHRGTEATLVTEARVDGTLVWTSSSTYLARHRTTIEPPQRDDAQPLPAQAEWQLPAGLGRRYASLSGDRNPIHLHPLTARLFGFPRAIAHGMWTAARCLAEHQHEDQNESQNHNRTPESVHVRIDFKAPVLLPSTVTYASEGPAFQLLSADRTYLSGTVR
ncbi:MaoC family dehydratase [Streptomyces sp. NPDC048436]|uniref:MaoC family dehydratase n=1 Tax=Streptomyces sp. NPDC048436 TaxID=3365550 RepID=UPI003712F43D